MRKVLYLSAFIALSLVSAALMNSARVANVTDSMNVSTSVAGSYSISSVSPVNFGSYVAPGQETSIGTIVISYPSQTSYTIDLSTGNSGTYT